MVFYLIFYIVLFRKRKLFLDVYLLLFFDVVNFVKENNRFSSYLNDLNFMV